jgi:hypothetical protein
VIPDLLKYSDDAKRSGATALNQFLIPGGLAIGDKSYTNLKTAATAFADELSLALGIGNATDMAKQMGFEMTDFYQSPENLRSNLLGPVARFIDNRRNSLLSEMGPYGEKEKEKSGNLLPKPAKPGDVASPEVMRRARDLYQDIDAARKALEDAGWKIPAAVPK